MWATWPQLMGRHIFVEEVLSSITSPAFHELVIVIDDKRIPLLCWDTAFFGSLRMMYKTRSFKLAFLAEVEDQHQAGGMEGVRQCLAEALGLVAAKGWLDFLDSPPAVRTTRVPKLRFWVKH